MLDINLIRKNPDLVKEEIEKRQMKVDVNELLKIDKKRRNLLIKVEKIRAERNKLSDKIPRLSDKEKQKVILESKTLSEKLKRYEPKLKDLEKRLKKLLLQLPNLSLSDVPIGKDESENKVMSKWGEIPDFSFKPKDHLEIGEYLDLIDIKRAGKVSGSRFGYLKNEAVLLQQAVIKYALDTLIPFGFIPVIPPVMIKEKPMEGMGYLTHAPEEIYFLPKDKLYLVGTSEQSIGPYFMDEVLNERDLPKRFVAISTCFRREAGAYGKDTRGILRVHQFDKVEMFSFSHPDKSKKEHQLLLSLEEKLVQGLKIPYQVVKICTADLAIPSASSYDIECWMPSQNKYRETHSTSNCTDFQSRRLNIKYRDKNNRLKLVHTLNGTAFATRIIIAILENYQQRDGSVLVPRVLQKYCGFKKIKRLPK